MEERVLVSSFHQRAMSRFRKDCPTVATGATPREAWLFYQLNRFHADFLQTLDSQALQVPATFRDMDVLTPRFLNRARQLNLQVHVWTINDIDEMKRLVALGVNGIMTDYPDRLLELMGRYPHPTVSP
jgi:glycerophosphoryl diester phosphodiesterase